MACRSARVHRACACCAQRNQAEKASRTQALYEKRVGGWLTWTQAQEARVKAVAALAADGEGSKYVIVAVLGLLIQEFTAVTSSPLVANTYGTGVGANSLPPAIPANATHLQRRVLSESTWQMN